MWGNARILEFLKKQRALYKYINDQSVRLMNEGYTGVEISNMIKLPPELDKEWYDRGYYGTVKHDSRAVYQRYMGFYDGNPSTLDELPPAEAAAKYVEYMGGAAAVMKKAQADFDKGQYRWVAMAVKHVVFADPSNTAAKNLLADAYEQMGYQAESGPWRSVYLQGALELRNGVPTSRRCDHRQPRHDPRNVTRALVRLPRRAPQRREGRRQEAHSQHQLHGSQEALRTDGRERRAHLRRQSDPERRRDDDAYQGDAGSRPDG